MSTSVTAADLRAEADRRIDDAVAEALEQMCKGWKASEIAAVMDDAAKIIGDLLDQADVVEESYFECHRAGCNNLTADPIRDEIAASWIGDKADTYCSEDCLAEAAEDYWTRRQADRDLAELYAHHGIGGAL